MVSITPTSVGGIARLSPIELSNATGTNSVVLKMKAESASANTPHHECFAATESGVDIPGGQTGQSSAERRAATALNRAMKAGGPVIQEKARTAAGENHIRRLWWRWG